MSSSTSPPITPRRRTLNRSYELEYAGPLIPTPPISPTRPPRSYRTTRSNGSSQDDEPVSEVINEDFRCGGPTLLPLPYSFVSLSSLQYQQAWRTSLKAQVERILAAHGVQFNTTELFQLMGRAGQMSRSHQYHDFIHIRAVKRALDNTWKAAAQEILRAARGQGLMELNVEIIDEPRGYFIVSTNIINRNEPLVRDWPAMSPQILDALKPTTTWQTLDLLNRTRKPTINDTSLQIIFDPTVVVSVRADTTENFKPVRERLCRLLASTYPTVSVEIVVSHSSQMDDSDHQSFLHYGERLWQKEVYMGSSIQSSAQDGAATLGCFLRLKHGDGTTEDFGLTNFHVVQAVKEANPLEGQTTDWQMRIKDGMRPGRYTEMYSPASKDLNAAIAFYAQSADDAEKRPMYLRNREILAGYERPEEAVELGLIKEDTLQAYQVAVTSIESDMRKADAARSRMSDRLLGIVWAASGSRTSSSGMLLDWALVRIDPSRMPKRNYLPPNFLPGINLDEASMRSFADARPREQVFKIGRSTDRTTGFVNAVATTKLRGFTPAPGGTVIYQVGRCRAICDKRDQEYNPNPQEGEATFGVNLSKSTIAKGGDSGSAFFNREGQFVGLLVGGDDRSLVTYMLPVGELFADIKAITGAEEVSMMVKD